MIDDDSSIAEYEEFFDGSVIPDPTQITRTTHWRTKTGERIRICNMGDSHLLNTIRVLRAMSPLKTTFKTTPERRRHWLNTMASEAYARGLELDPLTETEPVHE